LWLCTLDRSTKSGLQERSTVLWFVSSNADM
jgi:hypothetical protein